MHPLIRMQHITKIYYSGGIEHHVLKEINLDILPNEWVAIMGPSGSGKSTLMNIIGLLDRATTGNYFLNSKDVSKLSENEYADLRNQTIGFIFQSFFLLPRLTILENVMLPLYYRRYDDAKSKELARFMLNEVGLEKFGERFPKQLSGGQQQRAAIARALVGNPSFILADEPTGSLDVRTGQIIMRLFKQLHEREKVTIIIITHDPTVAAQCERTITIQDGQITQ